MSVPTILLTAPPGILAAQLQTALAGHYRVAVADPVAAPAGAALLVALLQPGDLARFDALQQAAARHGLPLVAVAADADCAWVGPTAAGAEPGCLHCMQLWTRTRWSGLDRDREAADGGRGAWSATQADILAGQLLHVVGEVLARPAAPLQQMLRFDARTLECTRHALSAHPDCPHCNRWQDDTPQAAHIRWRPRTRSAPRSYRQANPALEPARLKARLVDPRIGFVRKMYDDASAARLMPQVLSAFIGDHASGQYEVGCGRTGARASSEMVSLLEALERFCGFAPRAKRTTQRGSYRDLAPHAVDPRSFILHDDSQRAEPGFAYVPYSPDLDMNWVWAHSMRHDGPRLVPEQLAYYRLPATPGRQDRFLFEISNGCALGNSIEEAVLHGLFEVIERDAFLCTWYGRITPVELDLDGMQDPACAVLRIQAETLGATLRVFDMDLGLGVPAILVLIVGPDGGPVKSLCLSGAHLDPEQAIMGALGEALASFASTEWRMTGQHGRAAAMLADPSLVRTMADHQVLYSHPDAFSRLDFLTRHQTPVPVRERFAAWYAGMPPADMSAELAQVSARVLEVADDLLVVDQTSAEVARLGLRCVKVLAPGLLPMTFGHQHRRVSVGRVNRALEMLGQARRLATADLNPHPHNFP